MSYTACTRGGVMSYRLGASCRGIISWGCYDWFPSYTSTVKPRCNKLPREFEKCIHGLLWMLPVQHLRIYARYRRISRSPVRVTKSPRYKGKHSKYIFHTYFGRVLAFFWENFVVLNRLSSTFNNIF